MPRLLSMEEIVEIILDYIKDDRKNQAVLLNGEWGCGKTYFVKEKLIPKIDKEKYQIFQISLYGVSSIEKIQDMIYGKWIKKTVGDKTVKLGPIGDALTKEIEMLGKSAVQFVENKIGTDGSALEAAKGILENNIGKNKTPILIFDDIERCQTDIIELMGFLNNLSENNGYRLILVANEQEINRDEDDIVRVLKYEIALNSRLDINKVIKKRSNGTLSGENQDKIKIDRDELEEIANYYFDRKTTYERTREKLIGLTIPYSISIAESFEGIISKYIKTKSIKELLKLNKEEVFDLFEREEHRNLRTLIAACIAIEDIISSIEQEKISEKEILKDELKMIVLYTVYSAMRRTDGKGEYHWASGTRYGWVNNSMMKIRDPRIYGYAFIDEYWKTQCIDAKVVYTDIKTIIDEKVAIKKDHEKSEEYRSLALNHLIDWHLLSSDKEVKQLVQQMKEELKQKKYYPQDFKEIIFTLMRINNPNFGMNPDKIKIKENNNTIFDSMESRQFIGMPVVVQEAEDHLYAEWEKFDISEFINLMVAYFDDEQFVMTKNMIRVLSEDKQFVYNYRQLTMPLIKMIEKKERDKISANEDGILISDMSWDDEFEKFCFNHKKKFFNQGRFLFLFNYDELIERFIVASPIEIHHFCSAVQKVYSFSNLSEVYSADYETVKRISDYISKNIDSLLNEDKSRVKEIALRRLKSDMNRYEHSLRKTNITE